MNKSTDHIGSLAKGLRVLAAFGQDRPRMSIADASAATGLDRATARRCLLTLHAEGYASYDGKFFALTHRATRLGAGALDALPMAQIVQPWLDQLTERIGQSCSVAVLDGTEIVYLARAAQARVMSIGLSPGSRLPAFCTSMGRILLAAQSDAQTRDTLTASDMSPRTRFSLTTIEALMDRIQQARTDGFAIVDQEIEIGLRSIAVPLFDTKGRTVAALNIGMAAIHPSPHDLSAEFLSALTEVQQGLARLL